MQWYFYSSLIHIDVPLDSSLIHIDVPLDSSLIHIYIDVPLDGHSIRANAKHMYISWQYNN